MSDAKHLAPPLLYSVALLPPPHVCAPLAAIRAGLDPEHAPKTTPHITLKQPFTMAAGKHHEETLVRSLAIACAQHAAFRLDLEGVDFFESPRFGCVLYMGARSCSALSALSSSLVRSVARLGHKTQALEVDHEVRLFFPHLTLAQGLCRQDAERARHSLQGLGSFAFPAERLVVGRCAADGVWERPYELGLAGSVVITAVH